MSQRCDVALASSQPASRCHTSISDWTCDLHVRHDVHERGTAPSMLCSMLCMSIAALLSAALSDMKRTDLQVVAAEYAHQKSLRQPWQLCFERLCFCHSHIQTPA